MSGTQRWTRSAGGHGRRRAGNLPATDRALQAVEAGCVLAHHLALRLRAQRGDLRPDRLEGARVQTGGMGEVRLEHDVVLAHGVDEVLQVAPPRLEPEGGIPVVLEVLRWPLLQPVEPLRRVL